MTQPYKMCPHCQQPCYPEAPQCWNCGLMFATPAAPAQLPPGASPPAYYPPQPPFAPPYASNYPPTGYAPPGYAPQPYNPYPLMEAPPGKIRVQPGSQSTALALILCFVITGGGQFYNKQIGKGVLLLLSGPAIALLGILGMGLTQGWSLLVLLLLPFLLIGQFIDAYKIAERLNRGEIVDPWQWF